MGPVCCLKLSYQYVAVLISAVVYGEKGLL